MRKIRIAFALATLTSSVIACNALVGVEDVKLQSNRDAGPSGDDDEDADVIVTPDATVPVPQAQVALALGDDHSCGRNKNGDVFCWGSNAVGQLGDGLDGGPTTGALPQLVKNVSGIQAIGAGRYHTCAISKAGGTVQCWGSNLFGQLGIGTDTPSSSASALTALGVSNAIQVSGGTSFTCALITGGTVMCWGANYSGQLGDGTTDDRVTPFTVPNLAGVTGIATGEFHSCAIVAGAVRCWGRNLEGQLGNGGTTSSLIPPPSGVLTDIVQVVASSSFSCARQTSGKVYCWGANTKGELGTGIGNPNANPSPVLTNVSDAVHIWAGYEHACAARKTGAIVCWGSAGEGQTGSGIMDPDASLRDPTPVMGVSGALAVSTGGSHSCATNTDGKVYCWGGNDDGQIGNGRQGGQGGEGANATAFTAVQIGSFP